MSLRGFLGGVCNVNPSFGRNYVEDAYGGIRGVRMKNGNEMSATELDADLNAFLSMKE